LRRILTGLLCLFGWLVALPAWAGVQRFAVIVGNNRGQQDDVELRYAEADAEKVANVLRDIGSFAPADIVVLRNEDADTVRSTLITFNDRIRAAQSSANTQTLLFVYYSGHADAQALRLGGSRLELSEVTQLVRGSAATFRLLVVDACRSGTLTRVKSGRPVAPFALATESELHGEGLAFLTASSANEDAQESDEIRGSFFTHAFVSGLLGAADRDHNGAVTLEEAYRHAYDATLRATSSTFAGTQHPTFQFEVRGQEWLVLTRPGATEHNRGRLVFPRDIGFLVMGDSEHGPVVAEVSATDGGRALSVRPGRYFVRGRASDALLEGTVAVAADESRTVEPAALQRVAYARLVRKGARASGLAQSPQIGVTVRSRLPNAAGPCWGPTVGYRVELASVSLAGRLGWCMSGFDNTALRARTDEYSLGLSVEHAWDFSYFSVSAALGAGAAVTNQSFETTGVAPGRHSPSGFALAGIGASRDIGRRCYLGVDARAELHLLNLQDSAFVEPKLRLVFALRTTAVFGVQF
jgi:hypothetical protein